MVKKQLNDLLLLAIIFASFAFGQTAGRILGTVKDQDGQPVAKVNLTVEGEKSAEKRTLQTEADGSFVIPQLAPDTYQISATCSTCNDVSSVVELGAGQARTVSLVLSTQSTSSLIKVDRQATTMDRSSARLGVNVTAAEVGAMPVNGRTFAPLSLAAPLMSNAGGANFGELRFNGQALEQNRYRLDNVDFSSVVSAVPGYSAIPGLEFRLRASVDAVQEFRVDSALYTAEAGSGTGGQVSLVSQGGSNDWHGALFEYLRNDKLQARNFFDDDMTKLRMNQFGARAGGALRKDRLFVFGSFETLRQRAGVNYFETVPSLALREEAVPAVLPWLAAMPVGTLATADDELEMASREDVARQDESNLGFRVDYVQSAVSRFFARYSRSHATLNMPDNTTTARDILAGNHADQSVFTWNREVHGAINSLTLGLNRSPMTFGADAGDAALAGSSLVVGIGGMASPGGLLLLPSGEYGRGAEYRGRTYSVVDTLDWSHGAHSLKAGVEARLVRIPLRTLGGTRYAFLSDNTFLENEDADATYLADLPWAHARQEDYAAFLQDEWRLAPNVVLTAGIRYEYYAAPREADGKASIFDPQLFQSFQYRDGFYSPGKMGWNPRVGLTWAPKFLRDKTVVRMGAGSYQGPFAQMDTLRPIQNMAARAFLEGVALPVAPEEFVENPESRGQPLAFSQEAFRKQPRVYQFGVSIQQALPGNMVGQIGYNGNLARHLSQMAVSNLGVGVDPESGDMMRANPAFSALHYTVNGGNSSYHALQAGLSRRFVDTLTLSASYGWSHSIGDSLGAGDEVLPQDSGCLRCERADNSFDIRHTINVAMAYELPFGPGRQHLSKGLAGKIAGGWSLAGIWNARTGLPVNVLLHRADEIFYSPSTGQYYTGEAEPPEDAYAMANIPGGGEDRLAGRPNVVAGVNPYLKDKSSRQWINPAAFSVPMPGTFGNLGRNALRGPGFSQIDAQITRRFRLSERQSLAVRIEAFNLANHTNFANPTVYLQNEAGPGATFDAESATGFGLLTSTVGRTVGLGTSRQFQLSARYEF